MSEMEGLEAKLEARFEELLGEIRTIRRQRELPAVLTKARAAQELSISLAKLKSMIRDGKIMCCDIGSTKMVPRSEIERLARPNGPTRPPRRGGGRPKKTHQKTAAEERDAIKALTRKL